MIDDRKNEIERKRSTAKELVVALQLNDQEMLSKAINKGASAKEFLQFDFDAVRGEKGRLRAIHLAARNGHLNAVKDLIRKYSCDVDEEDGFMRTAVFHAVLFDRVDVVKALVNEFESDLGCCDAFGDTVVSVCAKIGSSESMEVLINGKNKKGKADIKTSRGRFGLPPIVEASCTRTDYETFPKVANMLRENIEEEFTGRFVTSSGRHRSFLMLACGLGNDCAVRFLCDEWKMDPNGFEDDQDGSSPLEVAREGKFEACERELLKRGAKERKQEQRQQQQQRESSKNTVGTVAAENEDDKARLQELLRERERLSFIVQANEDEIFQTSMREPRIRKAVDDIMENFLSVEKYAGDEEIMATLSKWRGCQRFFKTRGEKVGLDELVIKEGHEDEIEKRKERMDLLSEQAKFIIMDVAKKMPKGSTDSFDFAKLTKEEKEGDDDDIDIVKDENGVASSKKTAKEVKARRMFYLRVCVASIQFLPLIILFYLRFFRPETLNLNPARKRKPAAANGNSDFSEL